MLAVEICSACYCVDNTHETVVGNAICADGAAAFLLAAGQPPNQCYPQAIDFETFIDTAQIEDFGLQPRDGKLRIVLGASIQRLAGPMIENALRQQHLKVVTPFPGEIAEAKRTPGGCVYRIAGKFGPKDRVAPEAIVGAWNVDADGNISGDFINNKNDDPKRWPGPQ